MGSQNRKINMKKISLSALSFLLAYSALTVFAFAQTQGGSDLCAVDALAQLFCNKNTSIPDMLNSIFQIAIAIG